MLVFKPYLIRLQNIVFTLKDATCESNAEELQSKENEYIEHDSTRPVILIEENTNIRNPLKEENIQPTLKSEEICGSLIKTKIPRLYIRTYSE